MYTHHNVSIHNRQEVFKEEEINSPSTCLSELTKSDKKVVRYYYGMRKRTISVSHDYVGAKLGISPKTVRRALRKMEELKLITWRRRFNTSCVYTILPFMHSKEVRSFLNGLFALSISLLLSSWDERVIEPLCIQNTVQIVKEHISPQNVHLDLSKDNKTNVYSSLKTEIGPPKRRGSSIMEQEKEKEDVKRELIKKLSTILPLTQHGMLYLARYDSIALQEMIKSGLRAVETTDPFRYLCKIGEKYTTKLDMEWYHKHREKLKIPIDHTDFVSTVRLGLLQSELKAKKEKEAVKRSYSYSKEDPHPARHHSLTPWKPTPLPFTETPQETIEKLREHVDLHGSNDYLNIILASKVVA